MSNTQNELVNDPKSARHVFWASYFGWLLDGYDTTIYAFVLLASLAVFLPGASLTEKTTYGLAYFAIFLVGWGTAFIFGPISDKYGRMKALGIAILLYAVGTFGSGLSFNIYEFGVARFVAGFGLGAEWFIGGTGVAEVFPEKDRQIWAGRFHSAWYAGFMVAAATTPFILYLLPATYNWRVVFFIGIIPAVILAYIRISATEPKVWLEKKARFGQKMNITLSLRTIFSKQLRTKTILLILVMVPVVTGLYGGTLFAPTAISNLVHATASLKTASTLTVQLYQAAGGIIISGFTLTFCLLMPFMVRRIGRKATLAVFMSFMIVGLVVAFGIIYPTNNLYGFLAAVFLLGIGGADFSVFTLWVPEEYPTEARAGGFGMITTLGRYAGAGLVFVFAFLNARIGLGHSLAYGAVAFAIGLVLLIFVKENRNAVLDRTVDVLPAAEGIGGK
ncbi:MAG TPA: MFS transporter [Thermoplasmataceae archaeon]|nr:MFS transporter [Thermoplasmatales archaeon AK]HLH86288.1 MFS transporter [Thermoplasmataceae archaeon]